MRKGGWPVVQVLDLDLHDRIEKEFKHHLTINQTAAACRISKYTLQKWLRQGEEDLREGKDTPLAQLAIDCNFSRSVKVMEYISILQTCPKNYQAICWLLEKVFAEDFGRDSGIIKDILATHEFLLKQYGLDSIYDLQDLAKKDKKND